MTKLAVLAVVLTTCVLALPAFAAEADSASTSKQLTNSLGMKFTTIPAGEFLMGSSPEEIAERRKQLNKRTDFGENGAKHQLEDLILIESEGPQHHVTISQAFWFGTYEVTQAEFQAVMGFNPSSFSATGGRAKVLAGLDTKKHPVDSVSWNDAVEFCRQLSSLEAEVAAGRSYRLPTEAEWEYAYRAGTRTTWYWGDETEKKRRSRFEYPKMGTSTKPTTVPVGTLEPNPWGLYDMTGNVREWCADWFDLKAYTKDPVRDPVGPATGEMRVSRGAWAYYIPPAVRSAARKRAAPDFVYEQRGFRVVCVQGEVPKVAKTNAMPAQVEAQLKQKGLMRQGTFFVLAEEGEFARYATTLERMRVACFNARREVDDAKKQLQHVEAAKAGTLAARSEARNMMRYSDTWREHRNGVISRNIAHDALVLVDMSREDVEQWLGDAQADYDAAVERFAEQCGKLREMHGRLHSKQRELAADSAVQKLLASASAGGKTKFQVAPGANLVASLKKLEHEESVLQQLQARQ